MDEASAFRRIDETSDELFYREPRLVEHLDERALAALEQLYRTRIPSQSDVLDLMSSWVSHLPPEVEYRSVTGLGLNAAELAANPRLDERIVHDLNADPNLPFPDASFDVALICVSMQYLTRPVAALAEVARVVRPSGSLLVTFSNRCFPTKAVAVWQMTDHHEHLGLIASYLEEGEGWEAIETLQSLDPSGLGDPLYAVVARRAPV